MSRHTIQCNQTFIHCPTCDRLNVFCLTHREQVHQCGCEQEERNYPVDPKFQIETNRETVAGVPCKSAYSFRVF